MKHAPLRKQRLAVSLMMLVSIASACVKAPPPKVAIENLQSNILFGVPTQTVQEEGAVQAPLSMPELEPFEFEPFAFAAPRPSPTFAPEGPCPTASFTAFPEESAGTNVEEPPKEGAYRWKRSGTVTAADKLIAFSGLERSLVRGIAEAFDPGSSVPSATPSKTWVHQTVQPIGDMKLISDFQVRTNGQANDPERGVVLKGMQLTNASGAVQFSFSPTVGLLYLPLPVAPGSSFSSEAVDPSNAQRWSISGKVASRERVDACGELVEGWLIQADLSFSGARSGTQKFEYVIAPQLGGILIREQQAGEGYLRGPANTEFSLGQLNPDPLTQAEK